MDGFDTNDQVIVCAATNRVDVLDPALTRPGRFDRQIYVPLPDVKGRMEILKVHSRKVKLGPNVDLLRLARATPGFSGADLAAIINESALGATLAGKEYIEQDDLEEARDKVRWGRARKSRVIDEKEKVATAYHEAGHAVVQFLLRPDADPIHKVTIIPRGNFGGATMALPEKDRNNLSRKWCIATMKVCFGGRIAEEMFCGDVNTGALGDIRQATGIARKMVRDWGMNDRLGFVFYGEDDNKPSMFGDFGGGREYSEETAKAIDEEVKKLIDSLYEETRQLLEANRDRVEAMAKALVRYETLDSNDIDRIMRGDNLTKPTVSDLLEKEQTRRGHGHRPRHRPTPSPTSASAAARCRRRGDRVCLIRRSTKGIPARDALLHLRRIRCEGGFESAAVLIAPVARIPAAVVQPGRLSILRRFIPGGRMAEKATSSKKRPPRQQMLDALAESEKVVAERRESQARPEEKVEAKLAAQAVAVAEGLSTEGVAKAVGDLKSVVGKMLNQLSDRLEEQVERYVQIQRAIVAKDAELKEIYEIQRSASTLTALIESHEQQRSRSEAELAEMKVQLERDVEQTRAEWDREKRQRDAEAKERDVAEQKRREREKEEYRYAFARATAGARPVRRRDGQGE